MAFSKFFCAKIILMTIFLQNFDSLFNRLLSWDNLNFIIINVEIFQNTKFESFCNVNIGKAVTYNFLPRNLRQSIWFRTYTISFIILWDFMMFYQIFLSPQVKRWTIITYKPGIYKLLHKLPNDLRFRILGN